MTPSPAELARQAAETILASMSAAERGVVVDSPPGAGKSTLVVTAAARLAAAGERVMLVAQTNEQVDDLTDRLALEHPALPLGRLSARTYVPSPRILRHPQLRISVTAADLADRPMVIGTAHKWATLSDGSWPWAIIDEAYQMRSDLLLRLAGRFNRALFVGDPGQLDPFSTVEIERWTGLTWDPMQSAVAVLLRHNPGIPVHTLPVSWRLPPSAVEVVADASYPFTGFQPGTAPGERNLEFSTRAFGRHPVDEAIETAAATGWALYELPARHTIRTDQEAIQACAALASRLLERGTVSLSERSPTPIPVSAGRIAIGTAHRDQAQAIRTALRESGADGIVVDTANRLQGREFDVTIVLHPLSGRRDADAFALEAGRLCVLTTRHRHACLVVARAGIPTLLDAHPSAEPVHLNVPVKIPDGWAAQQAVLAHLQPRKVRAP